ncbi:MAG: lamin tail domain-containing protein [Candidatus Hatepunaea meridiana]|nr:lamin tail domain-containing protein [Candidatus Hatepunaea meridiana]
MINRYHRISFILILLVMLAAAPKAQILINEFLASNVSINPDMVDFDDYSDWIELFNPTEESVEIGGFFLTDNLDNPVKWRIPPGTVIASGGYLLFWADGYDDIPGMIHQRPYWPWSTFETTYFHTNFRISGEGEELGLFRTQSNQSTILISQGFTWKFLDDGSDQGIEWIESEFDDSGWSSGHAEFGYGDGDEATVISFGGDPSNKFPTTYFRTEFEVSDTDDYNSLTIKLKRDDGAVIYLNGNEIRRDGMPQGRIHYNTFANLPVTEPEENSFFESTIGIDYLKVGRNVLAVEIHQYLATSSDLSFDLALTGNTYFGITLVDSVTFGRQTSDVSYGRNPEHSADWCYFSEPTPAYSNSSPTSPNMEISTPVIFSIEGGFYSGSQALSLLTFSPTAEIRYSTNSSKPGMESRLYSGAISITENIVIRARTFEPGKLSGEITTNSYFINEPDPTLPVISFVADPQTLWDEKIGIYANNYKQREIPVSIEYFTANGEPGFELNAGSRIGGFNIWRFAQKPLTIYMRNRYGIEAINYQVFKSKSIGVFKTIVLRNGGDNWNTDMLRDAMTESITQGQMANGVQAYSPTILFMNGSYWGIHNIRERTNPQYFASNFGVHPDSIDHLEFTMTAAGIYTVCIQGDPTDYYNMIRFMNKNDLTDEDNYQQILTWLNEDSFIDWVVIEAYAANTSWKHNREWWRTQDEGSKWQWLITDLDRGFNMGNIDLNLLEQFYDRYDVYRNLIQNESFKTRFIQRFTSHLNNTFNSERLAVVVDSLSAIISSELPRHIEKWRDDDGISSMTSWQNNLEEIKQFTRERTAFIIEHLSSDFSLDRTARLTISISDTSGGDVFINGIRMYKNTLTGSYFRNIPIVLSARSQPGFQFAGWTGISDSTSIEIILKSDTTLLANFVPNNDHLIPREISTNLTLTSQNLPYFSSGDITVLPDVSFKVDAGVKIKMALDASIYVHGNMIVEGNEENPVSISPNYDMGVMQWGALCFINTTDTSKIKYTEIRGATHGNEPVSQKGAISGYNADLIIDNVLLEEIGFPIFIQYGSILLLNSFITTDVTCDYINVKYGYGQVEGCRFFGNNAPDTDAIDFDQVNNGLIRNNWIFNFQGVNCDGIDIGEQSLNVNIYGNKIYNCFDKGISIGQKSTVNIERNLIVDCNLGLAVKDESYAYVNQNSFWKTDTAITCYEKNPGRGGGTAVVVNTIISDSPGASIFSDSLSSIIVSYSLSDSEILPGRSNINADPLFINASLYNLELRQESPCIDAGDPNHSRDPDGSLPDLGAYYEFDTDDFPFDSDDLIVINEINYHSNDNFNPGDWVELYNSSNETVDISGWLLKDENDNLFVLPENSTIRPVGYIVISSDTSSLKQLFPRVRDLIGNFDFNLSEDSDAIRLYDIDNAVQDSLIYDDESPWPEEADGFGPTIELIDHRFDNSLAKNWNVSEKPYGTPGSLNSIADKLYEPPTEFRLSQNFPNPFNSQTVIRFDLTNSNRVTLTIYNLLGRKVSVLIDEQMNPGYHEAVFNASGLPSGLYIYKIEAGEFIDLKKMVMIR